MKEINIKILYQTRLEEDVISWENHVNEIIDGIGNGTSRKFKVYMTNPMPFKEMDNAVKELCDFIKYHSNTIKKYYRSEECVVAGTSDVLNTATYIIAFDKR